MSHFIPKDGTDTEQPTQPPILPTICDNFKNRQGIDNITLRNNPAEKNYLEA
jgi:hypothetical protein